MPRWMTMLGTPLVLFLVQHWWSSRAQGTMQDPLPYAGQKPRGPYVPAVDKPMDADSLFQKLQRWYDPALTPRQAAPLIAHVLTANPDGAIVGNNPVRGSADPAWRGPWTYVAQPVAVRGHPRYRWRPIRVYATPRLGLLDWIRSLPAAAVTAAKEGDIDGYARALADSGRIAVAPDVYALTLSEAVRSWLEGVAA